MQELFDFKSIEANKQGKKSEAQIKLIKEGVNPTIWLIGGLVVLGTGGCLYVVLSTLGGGDMLGLFGGILGVAGLFAVLRGLTTWNLRRKLLSEPVQTAEGTIKYVIQNPLAQLLEADHYSAETFEGKKLHPLGLSGINPKLPPGDYRFYFLNTRNWLLEAEPLFSAEEMRTDLNSLLATAFGYDPAKLETYHQEARAGQVHIAEGLPKLEMREVRAVGPEEIDRQRYELTVGEFGILVSSQQFDLIFEKLPHRVYYRPGAHDPLLAIEVV